MVVTPLGAESVTVNVSGVVPLVPTVAAASPMPSEGAGFGLLIVPVPVPVPIVAFVGADSTTVNCLLGPNGGVPFADTVIVCVVWPAANVRLPLAAV